MTDADYADDTVHLANTTPESKFRVINLELASEGIDLYLNPYR